jgi:hypothetical protein
MANKKTKNGENEKLDSNNIERVLKLLSAVPPITKKAACEILNIAYNTTRLDKILEKHRESQERDKRLRAQKRGMPATKDEISYIAKYYLNGESVEKISESLHRPSTFVTQVLNTYNIPRRQRKHDYFKPELIPEDCVRTQFSIGEKVYSARYDSLCTIEAEVPHHLEKVYRIWLVSDRWQQYAMQPASELASLQHLKEYGIT